MNKRLYGKRELSFNEFKKIIGQNKKSEKFSIFETKRLLDIFCFLMILRQLLIKKNLTEHMKKNTFLPF